LFGPSEIGFTFHGINLFGPGEIAENWASHPVHFRYPNEIKKVFHGAGRTGGINLFGLSGYIINYVNGSELPEQLEVSSALRDWN
jgi:hypothetical protein